MVHSQTTQFAIGPLSLETIITEKKKPSIILKVKWV